MEEEGRMEAPNGGTRILLGAQCYTLSSAMKDALGCGIRSGCQSTDLGSNPDT